jgi:Profilin
MQAVVAAYKDTADPKKVWGTGLHIAGQKYITLKADDRSLYGKKVSIHPLDSFGSYVPQWLYRLLPSGFSS